jgi:hypothetical protein
VGGGGGGGGNGNERLATAVSGARPGQHQPADLASPSANAPPPAPLSLQSPPWENAALCSADPNCAGFKAYKAQFQSVIKPEACWTNITPYWNTNDGMYIKSTYTPQYPKPAGAAGRWG